MVTSNKLPIASRDEMLKSGNYLSALCVLERASNAEGSGLRLIGQLSIFSKRFTEKDGTLQLVPTNCVSFNGPDGFGTYKLDDGTKLEYRADSDTLTFTANGVQYRIRAIQDSDKSRFISFGDESTSSNEGKSSE